jgi:phosphoribosyl-ATP pyrophosphohydrolase
MIIPSIDLMNGNAVQLVGGREDSLREDRTYGDPVPLARKFRMAGEIAVIDLDAALGKGSNAEKIRELLPIAKCRVGGGIRTLEKATEWLDAGAYKVILGTAAKVEIVRQLPRARVIAALDAHHGNVVVEGWQKKTSATIIDRIYELRDYVGGFLVTFVEREGRMGGTDLDQVSAIVEAAGKNCRVTIAGGITTSEEIAILDRLGADSQVGMAIYTGQLDFGDAISAPLVTDRHDGLFATVVCDESGRTLGLAYSSHASIREAVRRGVGVYQSRKRGLWVKGESSGNMQELLEITPDCDRDAIRFTVRQGGLGYCHLPQWTCFGDDHGTSRLERLLHTRLKSAPEGSYTAKLLKDPILLGNKLVEEASELAQAKTPEEVVWEASDLIYFTMAALARHGLTLDDVDRELDRRALRVTRKPGDATQS